ncbi:uncharacterized protein LOC126830150 isoform X3 [Patella vulgata]|nr:uncharacterized protein LOC126830150 isoform X3 [Patella vulgata]XP_050416391.1 uncharacterized protein LOC126830150 isoform X3 [Patella vulgata]XP_050416392.1 uncharacterized protein LOC126830150 isoform X3 [Patella vulgata]
MKEKIPGINSLSPFLEGLKFFIKTKAEYSRPKATFYEITVSAKLKIPTTLKAEILAGRNDWITAVEFLAIQFQENTGTTSVQEKTEVLSKNVTKYSSAESLNKFCSKVNENHNFTPCNRVTNSLSPPTQKCNPFPKKQVTLILTKSKSTGIYQSPVTTPVPTAKIIPKPDNSEISKTRFISQAVDSTRPTVVSHQLTSQNKSPAEKVKDRKPCLDIISKHIQSYDSEAVSQTEIVNYHLGKSLCGSPTVEFIDTKSCLDIISESRVKDSSEGEPIADLKPKVEDSVYIDNDDVCKLEFLGNSLVGYYGKDKCDHNLDANLKPTFKTQNIKKEIELIEAGNTVTINSGISEDASIHVKLADTSVQQTTESIWDETFHKKCSENGFIKSKGGSIKKLLDDASISKSLAENTLSSSSADASITETSTDVKLSSKAIKSTKSKQTGKPGLKNQSKRQKRKLTDNQANEEREDIKCDQSISIDKKLLLKRKCLRSCIK